jgi:hypothetical protein
MRNCDRCKKETKVHTMSMFNTEEICMECAKKERAHSKYEEARREELEEIRRGNFNFPGIGKPHLL